MPTQTTTDSNADDSEPKSSVAEPGASAAPSVRTVPLRHHTGRYMRGAWAALVWSTVALFFLIGAVVLAVRYIAMPRVDEWRPQIERVASRALNAGVSIGSISASWRGVHPYFALSDVRIADQNSAGGSDGLRLPKVEGTLSWLSVLALQPRFSTLHIQQPELRVARLADGRFSIAGLIVDPRGKSEGPGFVDWLLAQKRVAVNDARVQFSDQRPNRDATVELAHVNARLENAFGSHKFGLQAIPPATLAGPIDLRARFRHSPFAPASDFARWSGEAFGEVGYADVAALMRLLDASVKPQRGHGALRGWLTFDHGQVIGVVADVALTQVRVKLADDLEPLTFASVQGRILQRSWGGRDDNGGEGGHEFEALRLALVTVENKAVAPFDLKLRTTRPSSGSAGRTQVSASRLDLRDLAWLATHVPLALDLREAIDRHAIAGTLHDATASWVGPRPDAGTLTMKARFEGLASAAQAVSASERRDNSAAVGLPGFENLSGNIDLANGAGSMQLASKDVTLIFPGVFAEPNIRLAQLHASVTWKSGPAIEVHVASASAANADFELDASGTYRSTSEGKGGAGWLDLSGRVTRLHAPAAFRYLPLVAGKGTAAWLQHALVAGRVTDGTFRVKGDLAHFPFKDRGEGEMRVSARVHDATLDVGPSRAEGAAAGTTWPLLSAIDAELVFDRTSMTITSQSGLAQGVRLANTVAQIADLERNPTLEVRGTADGALADMVQYVNSSPVGGWIGGFTANSQATGSSKLDLRLVIPLQHASDSQVAGQLQFINNDVTLADAPPFTRVNGTLAFTGNSVRSENLTATLLGGPAKLEATTRADGELQVTANGVATVPGIKRAITLGAVQQLLDRSQGSARYVATLTTHPGTQLKIESDLLGLAIDGIAPLSKTAQEPLPLRIERTTEGAHAERDVLQATAGRSLAVRFERRRDQNQYRLTRGVIAVNEPANLPESGVLVLVNMPRLDFEAWSGFLGDPAAAKGGAASDLQIDAVAIRTQQLIIMGRTFQNVTLGASRAAEGGFNANIVSDGVSGYVAWRPEQITARLSRLSIPAGRKGDVVDALKASPKHLPSLDIAAEQFELEALKLGRLELTAQNSGSAAAPTWHVRRLEITNPDMKLTASGEWTSAFSAAARRMKMNFKLDTRDAGATLSRFGFAGAMAAGHGQLEGDVEWAGSPLDIDYPTLGGKFSLHIDEGRFLRVETGNAARLLSLLSLQSLSRTLLFEGGQSFSDGFAYNSIRADATVAQGVISTNNFRMAGASAAVLMSGKIDLRHETQQMHLVVLPQIDASTAALALGVANPIIGVGAFLAQYVLRNPLSKAFALEYDISGTWANPVVVRRGKAAETTEYTR